MSRIKALLDEYGVIYEAMKILPDELKIAVGALGGFAAYCAYHNFING
jgi:hypothetical protein